MTPARRDERGFALLAVLLVLAILGVVGAEFAYSMRLEASAVRAYKEAVIGEHLAEAGIQQAIREISSDFAIVAADKDGALTFYSADGVAIPRLPRQRVPLGGAEFSYTIADEESRINVNTSPPERMQKLLQCHDVEKSDRDVIVDSILDWRDANEDHRLNGAESEDTYLKREVPYRSHNANIESIRELLQIKGITPALFYGTKEQPGLADELTAKTAGAVNINTAPPRVLCGLGLAEAEITAIQQGRRDQPYRAVPGQFTGRGLATTSRTFRIESRALFGDHVGARITVLVQKRQDQNGPGMAYVEVVGPR